uniref:Ig-like domain-containing protein n=1 Tax=Monopterus albus TaxID=43700 RepID=A0A3Q3JKM1_MONAL
MQAEEGSNVILRCELSKPGIPVEWRKGHELLRSGVKYQIRKRETTLELLIWKPVPKDSGVYSCVCADQMTSEGSVTLRCEVSKPGVPVEWRKDAQTLKEGEKYQMKQEGRVAEMLIRNATLTDAGEYCLVNKFGVSSYNGNITICPLPVVYPVLIKMPQKYFSILSQGNSCATTS